jgi:hemerythrin-like domain-containing protein
MKRVPELRDLSEDHHHGLVLARKARKAAAGEDGFPASDVWAEVEAMFKTELEPHFQIEESLIGAVLAALGESQLSRRLLDEHEALREFLIPGRDRTPDDLGRFGELLEKHIRFEERELFEVAQSRLNPDELSEVAKACQALRGGK